MFKSLNPLFNYLDGGKLFSQPFRILYYAIGVLTCLSCLAGIAEAFDYIKYMKGIAYVFAVLISIVLIGAAVFSLLYWFRRASEVNSDVPENARFLAIPAVGGLVITFAEWLGIITAAVGVCVGILTAIILPFAVSYGGGEVFLSGLGLAVGAAIGGYIIIVLGRLLGEQILAIGAIANDTRAIARNTDR